MLTRAGQGYRAARCLPMPQALLSPSGRTATSRSELPFDLVDELEVEREQVAQERDHEQQVLSPVRQRLDTLLGLLEHELRDSEDFVPKFVPDSPDQA